MRDVLAALPSKIFVVRMAVSGLGEQVFLS
jgi:hypothetical protein